MLNMLTIVVVLLIVAALVVIVATVREMIKNCSDRDEDFDE